LELGKFGVIDLEPEEIAQQLTLLEFEMFSQVRDREFHNQNFKSKDPKTRKLLAKNICRMIDFSNKVSYWVATEIVRHEDIRPRVAVIKKFIATAEMLKIIGNFNGLMEVIAGLNLFSVQRLLKSWAEVSSRQMSILEDLNVLMENKQNYKMYRTTLKELTRPVIPYLGVCLRDVIFLDEGNPNFVGEGVINYDKMQMLGDVVVTTVRYFQEVPYEFEIIELIQEYFANLRTWTEDHLYKQSLVCEEGPTPTAQEL